MRLLPHVRAREYVVLLCTVRACLPPLPDESERRRTDEEDDAHDTTGHTVFSISSRKPVRNFGICLDNKGAFRSEIYLRARQDVGRSFREPDRDPGRCGAWYCLPDRRKGRGLQFMCAGAASCCLNTVKSCWAGCTVNYSAGDVNLSRPLSQENNTGAAPRGFGEGVFVI